MSAYRMEIMWTISSKGTCIIRTVPIVTITEGWNGQPKLLRAGGPEEPPARAFLTAAYWSGTGT
jgi:hypothetical protein